MVIKKAMEKLQTSDFPTSRFQLSTFFRIGESFITFYASLAIAYHYLMKLFQVAYVTSLGCLCLKPASFETFGCMYVPYLIEQAPNLE